MNPSMEASQPAAGMWLCTTVLAANTDSRTGYGKAARPYPEPEGYVSAQRAGISQVKRQTCSKSSNGENLMDRFPPDSHVRSTLVLSFQVKCQGQETNRASVVRCRTLQQKEAWPGYREHQGLVPNSRFILCYGEKNATQMPGGKGT